MASTALRRYFCFSSRSYQANPVTRLIATYTPDSGRDEKSELMDSAKSSEHVKQNVDKSSSVDELDDDAPEQVEMWNKDAPAGPEWNGPRGYEPTRHGDWSKNGRVSDF